jgi:hypothetical protein
MKECRKCRITKTTEQFSPNLRSKDLLHTYCKSCVAANRRERYRKNPDRINELNERYKQELVNEINQIKTNLGCKFCKENEPVCLDFHHLSSEEKEKGVSRLVMAKSRDRALKEIKKCICVCSNCHRKIHAGLLRV